MKIYLTIFIAIFALVGCKSGDGDLTDQKEILEQINTHKMEIVDIQGEISKLEDKLQDLDISNTQGSILVGVEEIKSESFTHYLDLTGNVEAQLHAYVSPEINGLIKTINVKEGDYVNKGAVLATVDTQITRNTIEEVKTQLELATSVFNKQKKLWDQEIGSELQYLQAKSAKESLDKKLNTLHTQIRMATITAPFSGYIETVAQKVGEFGSPSKPLFYLVNLEDLKVSADVSESFLPYINAKDTVALSFPTFANLSMTAKIGVIGSVINPNNRTFKIQIPIKNENKKLLPNIIAKVKVADQHFDSAFVVPSIVVKNNSLGEKYVYLVELRDNKMFAKKQLVTTGNSYGNKTMIISGVKDGDQLITKAYNLVKNGSAIRK